MVVSEALSDERARSAPGFSHRTVPSGKGEGLEVADPRVFPDVCQENLPAPYGPVITEAGPVTGDPDDRACLTIFRETARDVRVVVLHTHFRYPVSLHSINGAGIIRVEVVCEDVRAEVEDTLEVFDRVDVEYMRKLMLEVADVLTQIGITGSGQADSIL